MDGRPRRPRRNSLVAASLVGSFAVAGLAQLAAAEGEDKADKADKGGEPIRLEYRASASCPDEAAFKERVRARTSRARFVEGERATRTFVVALSAGASGGAKPAGSVRVVDGARGEGSRRLESDTCEGVADALSLIVALALDPHALTTPRLVVAPSLTPADAPDAAPSAYAAPTIPDAAPSADPPRAPDAAPEPFPPPPDAGPAAVEDALVPHIALTPAEETQASDAAPAIPWWPGASARALGRHFFAGADFVVATGVSPVTTLAGAPYIGWRATGPKLLGPSLRAAFLRAGSGTLGVPGGTADFTWTVGRLDGCALLWPERALRLGACARVEAGVLDASGKATTGAATQHSGWFAVGAMARFEWTFLGPLLLDVGAGASFPISVESFYFRPGTTAHQVSWVGFAGEAGLGVHFL